MVILAIVGLLMVTGAICHIVLDRLDTGKPIWTSKVTLADKVLFVGLVFLIIGLMFMEPHY